MLFTENGVAMLSGVLNSERAIEINISFMRLFVKLRSYHALEERVERKMNKMETEVTQVFKVVFQRLDEIQNSELNESRRKIGIKRKD